MKLTFIVLLFCAVAAAQDEEWIREDINAGYARAKATGKPLLVAFR